MVDGKRGRCEEGRGETDEIDHVCIVLRCIVYMLCSVMSCMCYFLL